LLVVISVEFKIKDPLGLFDLFDVFSDTGADESVLEPTIGSFDFALVESCQIHVVQMMDDKFG